MLPALLISLSLATVAFAQSAVVGSNEDGGYLDPAFATTCLSACSPFNDGAAPCSDAINEDQALACACSATMVSAIAQCASCVDENRATLPNTASVIDNLVDQYAQGCSVTVSTDIPAAQWTATALSAAATSDSTDTSDFTSTSAAGGDALASNTAASSTGTSTVSRSSAATGTATSKPTSAATSKTGSSTSASASATSSTSAAEKNSLGSSGLLAIVGMGLGMLF